MRLLLRFFETFDRGRVLGRDFEKTWTNNMSQVIDPFGEEAAILQLDGNSGILEFLQYFFNVNQVLLGGPRENDDVVEIY